MKRSSFRFGAVAASVAAISACSMGRSIPLSGDNSEPVVATTPYNLPKLMLEVKRENGGWSVGGDYIRDPDHLYAFEYTPSPLSSDVLTVKRDPETGALSKVDASATDQTGELIKKGVEAFFLTSGGGEERAGSAKDYRSVFDPHADLEKINAELERNAADFRISCEGCRTPTSPGPTIEGIYTRPMTSIIIRIEDTAGNLVKHEVLQSPNGSPLVAMPLPRSIGVARTVNYENFKNGDPNSVVINKPSEGLGVVTSISGILGAVVAAPIASAQQVLNEESARQKALEAQTARLKADIENNNKRQETEEQQRLIDEANRKRQEGAGQNSQGDGLDCNSSAVRLANPEACPS